MWGLQTEVVPLLLEDSIKAPLNRHISYKIQVAALLSGTNPQP